ncbi:DUF2550 domain-containing protein [Georgenia halophila]|uniref:DUF2550 domain-containing protein n=1 Tax=Georgenia halophila TaxID=620889 RepID=UPI0031EE6FF2
MAAVAVVILTGLVVFAVRVRRLDRRVGSFECAVRSGGRDWRGGIAVYGVGRVQWYRLVSLSLLPTRTFTRESLDLVERRGGAPDEFVEVRCRYDGEEVSLAMRRECLAGLVSWLEAAPPRGEPLV